MDALTPFEFFVGIHQPSDLPRVRRACINVNRLRPRQTIKPPPKWMMDSGAFMELFTHGEYRHSPAEYVREAARWVSTPGLACIVTQDFMCEAVVLRKTGRTVRQHQDMTIERYDAIKREWVEVAQWVPHLMPVLQGFMPEDYARHVDDYGDRLKPGAWVGVGSVCKRQGDPALIEDVLHAITQKRPDLKLHGFGMKITALESPGVREQLASADSLAWSFAARKQGRNANDWREAAAFEARVATPLTEPRQLRLF